MKKLYSVKEAAKLLGVSTNTIYTYLKNGRLAARRIGMGRFKIPYISLIPFIEEIGSNNQKNNEIDSGENEEVNKNQPIGEDAKIDRGDCCSENYSIETKDIIFWRLFKALVFLGTGVINLVINTNRDLPLLFLGGMGDFVVKLLPFILILLGLITFAEIIYSSRMHHYRGLIHIITAFVFGYYSLVAIFSQQYNLLVFVGSIFLIVVAHFFSGVLNDEDSTFSSQFTKYFLSLSVIGGIVIILFSDLFSSGTLTKFVNLGKDVLALIWYGTLLPILIILIRRKGKNSLLRVIFFLLGGLVILMFSSQLTQKSLWEAAYLSYITGIFAIFLAIWTVVKLEVEVRKLYLLVLGFLWIAFSCIVGLYAIRSFHERERIELRATVDSKIKDTARKISTDFKNRGAVLVNSATNPIVKDAFLNENTTQLTNEAKYVFEKLGVSRRVIIFDADGNSIALYPHIQLGLMTNFSEREYFQKTKTTYKGYISNVFVDILGENVIVQTEPVFSNNKFIGMIATSLSLNDLSDMYLDELGNGFSIQVVDKNNTVVINSDKQQLGSKVNLGISDSVSGDEKIESNISIADPDWEIFLDTSLVSQTQGVFGMDLLVVLVILVNAIFALGFALVSSFKNRFKGIDIPQVITANKSAHSF